MIRSLEYYIQQYYETQNEKQSFSNYRLGGPDFTQCLEKAHGMLKGYLSSKEPLSIEEPFPEYQSSTIIHAGYSIDDEKFAKMIKDIEELHGRHKVSIVCNKKVNWAANGLHRLTEEEAADLKSKYDVTNLTPQDFYDLVADLTNLNAISADDAISPYCQRPEPFISAIFGVHATLANKFMQQPLTNMLQYIQDGTAYYSYNLLAFGDSYKTMNLENMAYMNRLAAIFEPLQR